MSNKEHWVICPNCGREFNTKEEKGYYYDAYHQRYTCPICVKLAQDKTLEGKERRRRERLNKASKYGGVGIFFLIGMFVMITQKFLPAIIGFGILAIIFFFIAFKMYKGNK